MRLPVFNEISARPRVVAGHDRQGVALQGCDILCLLSKAPQCIGKCTSGNIVECIACAGSAAVSCGCT